MKSKPRILTIGTTESSGGAASVGWNIGQELKKRGYWVRYIVGYKKGKSSEVHELKKPSILKFLEEVVGLNITALYRHFRSYILADDISFGMDEEIFNHPWYKQADVIHLHNRHGNFMTLKSLIMVSREKKLVWTLHDMWAITGHCAYTTNCQNKNHDPLDCQNSSYPPTMWNNDKKLWERKKYIYRQLQNAYIIAPSLWMYKKIIQTPLKELNVKTINNSVNSNHFKYKNPAEAKKSLGLSKNKIALFVAQSGTSNPRKNYDLFKKIAKKLYKKYDFICIGGSEIEQDGKYIKFIPFIEDQKTLSIYYQAADLLINPSKAETFGLTTIESLLSGTPVLLSNTGIASKVITNGGNGYVLNSFNLNEWVEKTKEILEHSKDYTSYIEKNYKKLSKNYSVETMVDHYIKIYEEN